MRTDAELFAFVPLFDPGVLASLPQLLLRYEDNGFFPGDMDIRTELMPSVTYSRAICVEADNVALRYRREPIAYRRALFLQRYFHVRRPAARADGLENLCDE